MGCKGVMNPPGVVGREFVVGWRGWRVLGCNVLGMTGGEVGAEGAFFFPRTKLSKSKVVSSIGPNDEVSCIGDAEDFDIEALTPGS